MSKPKAKRRGHPGQVALLIWAVPKTLKRRFKASCANKGISMKQAILNMLEDFSKNA